MQATKSLARSVSRPSFNRITAERDVWVPSPDRLRQIVTAVSTAPERRLFEKILLTLAWTFELSYAAQGANDDSGFEISATAHDRLVGSRFGKPIRDLLNQAGVLKRCGNYVVGDHSFRYKLAAWCWESAERIPIQWPTERKLRQSELQDIVQEQSPKYPTNALKHLLESLSLLTFREDFCLDTHIESGSYEGRKKVARYLGFNHFRSTAPRLVVKKLSGRAFHKGVNLPKDLRNNLQFGDQPIAEVDISNAQPLMLALFFKDNRERLKVSTTEVDRLLEITTQGRFYEEMEPFCAQAGEQRWQLKIAICKNVLFGRHHGKFTKTFEGFASQFPTAAAAILRLHQSTNTLASQLQRAEGSLMYRSIVPDLLRDLPGIPLVTVHDAILVPAAQGAEVAESIKRSVRKAAGVEVKVKVK
jgi:hypothetical protein